MKGVELGEVRTPKVKDGTPNDMIRVTSGVTLLGSESRWPLKESYNSFQVFLLFPSNYLHSALRGSHLQIRISNLQMLVSTRSFADDYLINR